MDDWKIPNRIELEYVRALKTISEQIKSIITGTDDPHAAVRKLKQLPAQKEYRDYCDARAMNMTTQVKKQVDGTWRQAARAASRGGDIRRAILNELMKSRIGDVFYNMVHENAYLIKTFPLDIARMIGNHIQGETLKGRRASDIAYELMTMYPDISKSRIKLIARTEVSKTQTALTKARADNLGLSWYVWRTSEDARVRSSHDHMNGVLVKWNDPPNPERLAPKSKDVGNPYGNYHAGNTFNCRCYPEPVISPDLLAFPIRVYYNGTIRVMRLAEFNKIA